MRTKFCLSIVFLCASYAGFTQGVGINETGANPHASSILDISSTLKGVLIPRMNNSQMNSIVNPADGLMIYCTDCIPKGFYHFNGTIWTTVGTGNNIYNTNGTLTANRTVSLNGNELMFSGGSAVSVGNSNTAHAPSVRLNTSGPSVVNGRALSLRYISGGIDGSTSGDYSLISSEYNSVGYTPLALNPFGGNVGVGTRNPLSRFTIDGNGDNPISGNPNLGQADNDLYFSTDGNLGLGWPSPTAKLEINSNGQAYIKLHNRDAYNPNTIGNGLWIGSGNSGTDFIAADTYEPNGYADIRFKTGDSFETATTKMTIREEGGVMIGRFRTYTRFTVDGANDNHDDVPTAAMAKNDFNVDENGRVGIGTFYPNSNLSLNGSMATNIRTMTSGTVADDDYTILVAGNITLPSPNGRTGRIYVLVNNSIATRTVTGTLRIAGSNSDLASVNLTNVDERRSITVQSDGARWWIISTN